MKKIRRGNDFVFAWEIERNGLPEDLSSVLEKHLYLSVLGKRVELLEGVDYDITGNVVRIEVTPTIANILGTYKAEFHYILPDNGLIDEDRKCAVDVDAFVIVNSTAQADDPSEFTVTSDMAIAFKGDKGDKGDRGDKGDKGDSFTYADFTTEQIAELKQPATDAAQQADTARTELTTAVNTKLGEADDKIEEMDTTLSTYDGRVTQVESDISQLAGGVSKLGNELRGSIIEDNTFNTNNLSKGGYLLTNRIVRSASGPGWVYIFEVNEGDYWVVNRESVTGNRFSYAYASTFPYPETTIFGGNHNYYNPPNHDILEISDVAPPSAKFVVVEINSNTGEVIQEPVLNVYGRVYLNAKIETKVNNALDYIGLGDLKPIDEKIGFALTATQNRTVDDLPTSTHVILTYNATEGVYNYQGELNGFKSIVAYDKNNEILSCFYPLPYTSSVNVTSVAFEAPAGTVKVRTTVPLSIYNSSGAYSFTRQGALLPRYRSGFNEPLYSHDGSVGVYPSGSSGKIVFVPSASYRTVRFDNLPPGKYSYRGELGSVAPLLVNVDAEGNILNSFNKTQLEADNTFAVPEGTAITYVPFGINSVTTGFIEEIDTSIIQSIKTDLIKERCPYDLKLIRGTYGKSNANFKTSVKVLNSRLRISFNFKFNADINVGELAKIPLLKIVDKSGNFVKVHYRKQATGLRVINENRLTDGGKQIMTTYPHPHFKTGFGWETNVSSVPELYRNFEFRDRTLQFFKPICGVDAFSIWYKGLLKGVAYNDTSRNVDDVDVQADFEAKKDWKITINDTELLIFNATLEISESFSYVAYPTVSLLYKAIESKTKTGETLQDFELNYLYTGSDGAADKGPSFPSNSLTKVTGIPFISTYPSQGYTVQEDETRLDAFPFFASYAKDDSVHTLELVFDKEQNKGGVLNVDGQFANRFVDQNDIGENNYPFAGAAYLNNITDWLINNEVDIYIGGDELTSGNVALSNLLVEVNGYTDLEFSWRNGRIASDYTPFILASGGHGIYKGMSIDGYPTGYDDEEVTPENPFPVIPAKYKLPRPGYIGDDYISTGALSAPSAGFVRLFVELKKRGYVNVTLQQVSDFFNGIGKLPRKCFYVQLDDYRTYAFGDIELRREIEAHGGVLNFCIETAKYLDAGYSGDQTGQYWITRYQDTNEHRLELQKRLRVMQGQNWEVIMHGENGNPFVGVNSKELYRIVLESIKMADYLEIQSDKLTWAAGQHTINAVKAFQMYGLNLGLCPSGEYPCLANPKEMSARGYMEQDTWPNIISKII
jgi:hypothetical protein